MAGIDMNAASSVKSAYGMLAAQKTAGAAKLLTGANAKAWQTAQDFESVFLNTMFNQMFTAVDGEGPFGGDQSTGVWRSFLTDEYARAFASKGGIGIASDVYRSLLSQQEHSAAPTAMETRS